MLKLILQENSFQFIGNNYLQTHGTAMGTKMAVAFANIFMADIETKMISQSKTKPIEWKRFIDDIFPLWLVTKRKLTCSLNKLTSILQLNLRLKFQITRQPFSTQLFLKQNVSEMNRSLTSVRIISLLKPFSIHILPRAIHWVWKEVLLKAKHSDYWEQTLRSKSRLITRGYPHKMIQTTLSEVNFAKRQSALQQKKKTRKQILPFVTTYHPSVRNLKNILMQNWNLIQNQPLLKNIFKDPPIISYKRGQSLKDMLVRAKI